MSEPVGRFALVLHSHLPWLAHHGRWPVGEEWLYQSIGQSYIRVLETLESLARDGHRNLLTLGVTPVLAAQLDDPHCLRGARHWVADWRQRAEELCSREPEAGRQEVRAADDAAAALAGPLRHGFSGRLRRLRDAGAIDLLGGPATHPFLPLLEPDVAGFALEAGLADHEVRFSSRPGGIWAPECGYRPGLEDLYQRRGVGYFVMDGPNLLRAGAATHSPWLVGDSDVVAFGRDLDVTYRVWSPRRGYPGGPHYRDFHVVDELGFRTRRVTSGRVHGSDKAPYDPERAAAAVQADAEDFVRTVHHRLAELRQQRQNPLVVAAYDTELFGHWWHEGPLWLDRVLRLLPESGVEVTTLGEQVPDATGRAHPGNGSWGSGKDWRVWAGEQVSDIVEDNHDLQLRLLKAWSHAGWSPDPRLDALASEALLALSSDWAFMVSKDSAAGYARHRHHLHHQRFDRLAAALETGRADHLTLAASQAEDRPFGRLDGRGLDGRR